MTSEAWNELGGQPGDSYDSKTLEELEAQNRVSPFNPRSAAGRALARKRSHAENETKYFLHGKVTRTAEQDRLAREQVIDADDKAIRDRAVRTGRSAIEQAALGKKRADQRGY